MPRVSRLMALAMHIDELIRSGEVTGYAEHERGAARLNPASYGSKFLPCSGRVLQPLSEVTFAQNEGSVTMVNESGITVGISARALVSTSNNFTWNLSRSLCKSRR
jgi:hypothetical protein